MLTSMNCRGLAVVFAEDVPAVAHSVHPCTFFLLFSFFFSELRLNICSCLGSALPDIRRLAIK